MRLLPGEVPADFLARIAPELTPDQSQSEVPNRVSSGGAEGNRTPDPQTASLMLSQLSYSPTGFAS